MRVQTGPDGRRFWATQALVTAERQPPADVSDVAESDGLALTVADRLELGKRLLGLSQGYRRKW